MANKAILNIRNLKIWYKTYRGYAKVVDGVNFYVNKGVKVGLVGESGCGKTTTMKSILRILDDKAYIPEGENFFNNQDILKMGYNQLQQVRKKGISMISQEPGAALNPVFTVGQQMLDVIKYSGQFKNTSKKNMVQLAINAIKSVMISDAKRIFEAYPYQLSGGMKQRICITMALVTHAKLIIADEPGTALDVTIQDQIHRLLRKLVEDSKVSLIMITHSLAVARELVDRIYIMYAGNIVETSVIEEIFKNPLHPYTIGLMNCIPRLSGGGLSEGIYGYIPDYINPTPGCRFFMRCPDAMDICSKIKPPLIEVDKGHFVACHKYC